MVLNKYCHAFQHVDSGSDDVGETNVHPILRQLFSTIQFTSATTKDVNLLYEAEEVCGVLGGLLTTFCKSGKDRTGMATTLQQSRFIGSRFGCGCSEDLLVKNANVMRVNGTRLSVTEKNIGKKVFSINSLQAKFLPVLYRPPAEVQEAILKTGADTS
jgi:hypothetical protein